ncbi:hypothetical protein QP185_19960 [Sphingomonas aerolata]
MLQLFALGALQNKERLRPCQHAHRLFDARDLGPHPAVETLAPERDRAGDKDEEQDPAEQQSGPGVQERLRLTEALAHTRPVASIDIHVIAAATAAARPSVQIARQPPQARTPTSPQARTERARSARR